MSPGWGWFRRTPGGAQRRRWDEIRQPQLSTQPRATMKNAKRCTSCRTEKPAECFRLRKIKSAKQGLGSRVATCTECEAAINPYGNMAKPPPLWVQSAPYEPDAEDGDVQRFRRELKSRGIARQGGA